MNGTFGLLIGLGAADGSGFGPPYLDIGGNTEGLVTGPAGSPPRYGGSFSGTATSAGLGYGNASDLPPALLDLMNHPDRLHMSGDVSGGSYNWLSYNLTIDPPAPTPVPEPAPIVAFGALLAWLGWRTRPSTGRRR